MAGSIACATCFAAHSLLEIFARKLFRSSGPTTASVPEAQKLVSLQDCKRESHWDQVEGRRARTESGTGSLQHLPRLGSSHEDPVCNG